MRLLKLGILLMTCLSSSVAVNSRELTRESYCNQGFSAIRQVSSMGKLTVMTPHGNGYLQQIVELDDPQLLQPILNRAFAQQHVKNCFGYMSDNALYDPNDKQVANIHFEFDQANVPPLATQSLQSIAQKFAQQSDLQFNVTGHTDNWGSDSYNQGLSIRRALNSADIMTYQGVDSDNITIEGVGETQPISDNSTKYGRSQNRRAVIYIAE